MYKPIDWPEVCYVHEAVYWIAFGRVPEFYQDEHGDARNSGEALQSGELVCASDWPYSIAEFEWAKVQNVDYDRYLDAPTALTAFGNEALQSPSEYIAFWETVSASVPIEASADDIYPSSPRFLDDVRQRAADFEWRKQLESVFEPQIELARAEIFQALAKGELSSFGLREPDLQASQHADEFEAKDFDLVRIDAKDWRLSFDWHNSSLKIGASEVRCVHVSTSELLDRFPLPTCGPIRSIVVNVYPGVVIPDDSGYEQALTDSPAIRRTRGRPKIAGGVVETAVKNWLTKLLKNGMAPDKREALIHEAMEFSANILGHKVKRTTAQSWLKEVLPAKLQPNIARNNLDIHAGN
jgi:hypothetical protein